MAIRAPRERGFGISGMSFGTSSGRTTLVYQWVRGGRSILSGTVDWPDAWYGARQHATELLAIAEAGMSGCAPASLPSIPWAARADKRTRVTADAYFPDYDGAEFDLLEQEIAKVGRATCPP
jgi:hypothetical protein